MADLENLRDLIAGEVLADVVEWIGPDRRDEPGGGTLEKIGEGIVRVDLERA
ncbi:MAG: hypothetical protein U0Q19_17830 [Kineosporiaceae bacterium]